MIGLVMLDNSLSNMFDSSLSNMLDNSQATAFASCIIQFVQFNDGVRDVLMIKLAVFGW